MKCKTEWTLEDILRLFEETGCPALASKSINFIEIDVKENVKKILSNTGMVWVAMPQKFPFDNYFNDSLVMNFTYDHNSEKYTISSFYPTIRMKKDHDNYFLDVVVDNKMKDDQYYKMLNYSVDEMIEHLKNMIRKCSKLTKKIRLMNVKNCTKEWEA